MADHGDLATWWAYLVQEQRDELRACVEADSYLPDWAVVSLGQLGYIDPMAWVVYENGEGGRRLPEPVREYIVRPA